MSTKKNIISYNLEIRNSRHNLELKYPFLKNVWDIYNEFDETVERVTENNTIYSLCYTILENLDEDIDEHTDFCMKLIRNLGHFSEDLKHLIRSPDRCDILHNWIYNSKKKKYIPDIIINTCFDDFITIRSRKGYNYPCSYDIYDSLYEDPVNITLLNIFEYNIESIRNTLNDKNSENNIPCQKFVCKSVKIYNDMYKEYCENGVDGYEKHTSTCSKLKQFKISYTNYLRNKIGKADEIPSLDDIQNKYFTECQKYEGVQALQQIANDENSLTYTTTLTQDKNLHEAAPIIPHEGDNKGSLMSPTLSTALGTAAGTSSILALLYKVNA
ncbi:hypothetical protein PVIIG_05512 [Plasmodium vivax India VII]|uniref:PIR Superfamily Protein n=1 Tax=Plasmodium vivax India VII TaxID=1077284 RepID=A0A0J9UUF4_PLAVI|nr:hypothetical protein PVIIG_05512 [Plasmodium vivax India VII]